MARRTPTGSASAVSARRRSASPATTGLEEPKVVSVLFCDLVGFTAAFETADPETVRARLGPYHEPLRERIEAFGGTVETFVGDAVMAVFGTPVAHEDDAERAVRAGLAILESLDGMNDTDPELGLTVRIYASAEATLREARRLFAEMGARPRVEECDALLDQARRLSS